MRCACRTDLFFASVATVSLAVSSMRGGGAFTLVASCCDGDGVSGGIAFIDAFVLLQVCRWQAHLLKMQQWS